MTVVDFLLDFQDVLQCDNPITQETLLGEMEEWDSLAVMACIAYFDRKFSVKTHFNNYKKLRTVRDVMALAKGAIA